MTAWKVATVALITLLLGGCWPMPETYFSSSAPGGKQTYVCGAPGYKLMIHSMHYDWVQMNINPQLQPNGGMHLNIWVDEDSSRLYRNAERAVASEPDSTKRWLARNAHAAANRVDQKGAELSGTITVTWPPDHRFAIPVTPGFRSFMVPGFTGDSAVVTLPTLTIDGQSETFPPVTVQRRIGVTMGGVNGC